MFPLNMAQRTRSSGDGRYRANPEVAALQAVDEHFSSGDVGGQRDIVHIAQAQQRHFVGLAGLSVDGVPEEQQQVYLVAGNARRDLLVAALHTGQKKRCTCRPVASEISLPVVPVATNLCWLRIRQYAVQNWTISSFF